VKGLVLAGGKGNRLRPLTATGAKQLVPVANKPVLFYALGQLVEAGITDIGVITGDTAAQVMEAVGDGSAFGAKVTYIPQSQPLGVAVLDDEGRVARLVEKPKEFVSDLAVIGVYFFSPRVHDVTPRLEPSGRGELEITDAIQGLIDDGGEVLAQTISDDWIDTGKKDDMLEANRLVLNLLQGKIAGIVDPDSTLVGPVVVEEGARISGSTIRGPVVIGAGTAVRDAYVGPFTAIGPDCLLESCEIENSIMLASSMVRGVERRIADSLIGREVVIEGSRMKPHAIRLLLGDHSRVDVI
jgi:glucose-1-phosphate thymidylyltransferase